MKKFILAFATMFIAFAPAMAQDIEQIKDNSLYTLDCTVNKGEQATISVQMKNSAFVQSIGLYFSLPEGIMVARNSRDMLMIDLSMERTAMDLHSLSKNYINEEYRVAILQLAGFPFDGNSGEVFTITCDIDENLPEGEYEIRLFNVELSGRSTLYDKGIISNHGEYFGKITVVDPTGVTGVAAEQNDAMEIYGVNGVKQSSLRPGLNIVKNINTGETKTVMAK